jgi:hypothetical protein
MTMFFGDYSKYTYPGLRSGNEAAIFARAVGPGSKVDIAYGFYRQQADDMGAVFCGYHWLNRGNIASQAAIAYQTIGSRAAAVDVEDEPGNDGYNGMLTVHDVVDFVIEYRRLGGTIQLVYLPHWYWQTMGSPSLQPLVDLGLSLWASIYLDYSDTGEGWAPYGGMSPRIWQYKGGPIDLNAFRGTEEELQRLVEGSSTVATPTYVQGWNAQNMLECLMSMVDPASEMAVDGTAGTRINLLAQAIRRIDGGVAELQSKVAALETGVGPIDYTALAKALLREIGSTRV